MEEFSLPAPAHNAAEHPLITFAIVAYNQEKYIREAVLGAFFQTYSPLQIILSDDCSPDGTYSIMEELARDYQGPHRIVLNRNAVNLGIGGHVNRIMELAQGEYIIVAAGDDISLPERTARTYEAFVAAEGRAMAVFSDCIEMDGNGNDKGVVSSRPPERFAELPEMCRHLFRGITGATNAWHRSVFDVFGPMRAGIVFEDRVIAFRASLLGEICHIAQPLVRYRRHDDNTVGMFHSVSGAAMLKKYKCFKDVYINNINDLMTVSNSVYVSRWMVFRCQMIMKIELNKISGYIKFFSGSVASKITGLFQVMLNRGNPWYVMRNYWVD